jgi:hypothetical protein
LVARCIFLTLHTVWPCFAISCFMVSVGIEGVQISNDHPVGPFFS